MTGLLLGGELLDTLEHVNVEVVFVRRGKI